MCCRNPFTQRARRINIVVVVVEALEVHGTHGSRNGPQIPLFLAREEQDVLAYALLRLHATLYLWADESSHRRHALDFGWVAVQLRAIQAKARGVGDVRIIPSNNIVQSFRL